MRAEADFTAYTRARWGALVGSLLHEGVDRAAAEVAVVRGLADVRRGWGRQVRESDVDVVVWEAVGRRARVAVRPGAVPVLLEVDDVTAEVRDGLTTGPPPADPAGLVQVERRRRRRVLTRALAAVATVLAVAAGGAAWWQSRPEPPLVVRQANPVPVPWYAEGRLQLGEVVVELPGVEAFAARGEEVVLRTEDGRHWRVAADGSLHPLDDEPPELARVPGPGGPLPVLEEGDRVLDSVAAPDGAVVHLVDNGVARRPGGAYVRLSETGRLAFVVCPPEGRACAAPVSVAGAGDGVRLR